MYSIALPIKYIKLYDDARCTYSRTKFVRYVNIGKSLLLMDLIQLTVYLYIFTMRQLVVCRIDFQQIYYLVVFKLENYT